MSRLVDYSELELVEKPAIKLFQELQWKTLDCFGEFDSGESPLGRETKAEVVLLARLRSALQKLNPDLTKEAIDLAIEELTRERGLVSPAEANRQVYELLKGGVDITIQDPKEGEKVEKVRVIDWNQPEENDFLLCSQFWVTGEMYTRRADLIGFVNGLPLVFIELKASHKRLKDAYEKNLTDYKTAIPQLFWYNALIILSNGSQTKVGSVTAEWEYFGEWKRIDSEGEEGVVSLETALRGTCEKPRLLDIVENFIVFQEVRGGLIKIVAKNHQYLGVNSAIAALEKGKANQGRLGIFWHTQGAGKTVSMIFFSQKILRKKTGNWTFVVVTDRDDLDDQAYKEFARSGVITEKHPQAESAVHLRQMLREDHRYVFTLIHKFRTNKGEKHPVCSERDDVIVIADEAHRTQYDTLALNMRTALPKAAFIAFTGTPLIAGEERTRDTFGDYVSVYNFKDSIDDGATVPLYYENRIPELQITNKNLNDDIYRVVEDAELDEDQEKKVEREFAREYHLVTRDDRLEKVAEDVVRHFVNRGHRGKGMVVCIDKATAVRMYDKVQAHWGVYLKELKTQVRKAEGGEREQLEDKISFMEETDMAVVVSQGQNEVAELKKKGLDIAPHRRRIVKEDLDEKFKDPRDPLRLVFVCAMWMTGFNVPSCSTIYIDKPLRNHTLMQTIARANRVWRDKQNGLIVDYFGVFRNLQKALAIYGPGGAKGESPVEDKSVLVELLKKAIKEAREFCEKAGFDLEELVARLQKAEPLERVALLDDALEMLVSGDERKRQFLAAASRVMRLYKAILPDPMAHEFRPVATVLAVLADKIRALTAPADISGVMEAVEEVLDKSIAAEGYIIHAPHEGEDHRIDLSKIDFEALQKRFKKGKRHTMAERLRAELEGKVKKLVRLNRTRVDYLEKFQRLVDEYNSGAINVEEFFKQLMAFAKELTEEEQRVVKEDLSEEELSVFDLLTKPEMELSDKERKAVKKIAQELLDSLKAKKLVLDWRRRQQSRAAVRLTIEEALDELPEAFTRKIYAQKCEAVYQHVFESYYGQEQSLYAA